MIRLNRNYGEMTFAPIVKRVGGFKKGCIPANKGKTWDEQGISKEKQELMLSKLARSAEYCRKAQALSNEKRKRQVIATDKNGNKQWFESISACVRAIGCSYRGAMQSIQKGYKSKGYYIEYF